MPDIPGRDDIDIDEGCSEKEDKTKAVKGQGGNDQPRRPADGEDDVAGWPGQYADNQNISNANPGDEIGQKKSKDEISASWAMVMTPGRTVLETPIFSEVKNGAVRM